jgi:hypothetical protein
MIDSPRSRFGFDHLVDRTTAWALEERERARTSHDCPPTETTPVVIFSTKQGGLPVKNKPRPGYARSRPKVTQHYERGLLITARAILCRRARGVEPAGSPPVRTLPPGPRAPGFPRVCGHSGDGGAAAHVSLHERLRPLHRGPAVPLCSPASARPPAPAGQCGRNFLFAESDSGFA